MPTLWFRLCFYAVEFIQTSHKYCIHDNHSRVNALRNQIHSHTRPIYCVSRREKLRMIGLTRRREIHQSGLTSSRNLCTCVQHARDALASSASSRQSVKKHEYRRRRRRQTSSTGLRNIRRSQMAHCTFSNFYRRSR